MIYDITITFITLFHSDGCWGRGSWDHFAVLHVFAEVTKSQLVTKSQVVTKSQLVTKIFLIGHYIAMVGKSQCSSVICLQLCLCKVLELKSFQ